MTTLRWLLWPAALLAVVGLTLLTDPFTNLRIATAGYYLVALAGLAVLTGLTGQVSLGHGAFMLVGAYTVALGVTHVPALPIWADLLLAVAVGGLAGLLVGASTARLRGPYLAGATLALAVGLPAVTRRFPDVLGGSNGLSFTAYSQPAAFGEVPATRWQAWLVWLIALLALAVLVPLARGRLGRTMRAVRDGEVAAALAGIHVGRTKVLAFVISAACGGLAGGLQAYLLGTASPGSFTPALSLSLLAALVLGGLHNLWGALWGALALVGLQAWTESLSGSSGLGTDVANNLPVAVFGAVLVVAALLFPQGVHGGITRLVPRRGHARTEGET